MIIVCLVYATNDKTGIENPNPIVVGPFQNRMDAFAWEKKNKGNKHISRIEIKNSVNP